MDVILVELVPPLAEGAVDVFRLRRSIADAGVVRERVAPSDPAGDAADEIAALVEAGAEQIVVSLDRLTTPDADGVHRITSFVWSVLAAGAQTVVLAGDRDVNDMVRHYKMDRAFEIFGDLEAALAHLDA